MSSGDIKGFYRQKKKGGVAKPPPSASSSSKNKSKNSTGGGGGGGGGASVGALNPALVSRGGALDLKDEYGDKEEALRQFDMDMKYGPCIGVDRLQRWERAAAMGLHPPPRVRQLLAAPSSTGSLHCLWEGRV